MDEVSCTVYHFPIVGPGWMAAARLWSPVRLQALPLESHIPQVHHRSPQGVMSLCTSSHITDRDAQ